MHERFEPSGTHGDLAGDVQLARSSPRAAPWHAKAEVRANSLPPVDHVRSEEGAEKASGVFGVRSDSDQATTDLQLYHVRPPEAAEVAASRVVVSWEGRDVIGGRGQLRFRPIVVLVSSEDAQAPEGAGCIVDR